MYAYHFSVLVKVLNKLSGNAMGVELEQIDRDPDDECNKPAKCGDKGPEIRFPFWLKDRQPERCGYGPGFALTCSPTNNSETLVDIPFFFKAVVKDINYRFQELTYHWWRNVPVGCWKCEEEGKYCRGVVATTARSMKPNALTLSHQNKR
ncbi:hypothetical protein C3L33_11399, partial [Rhododendron williamsianum]